MRRHTFLGAIALTLSKAPYIRAHRFPEKGCRKPMPYEGS